MKHSLDEQRARLAFPDVDPISILSGPLRLPQAILALGMLWAATLGWVSAGADWRQLGALALLSHAVCAMFMVHLSRWPTAYATLLSLTLLPAVLRGLLSPVAQGSVVSLAVLASLPVHGWLAWGPMRLRALRQREHERLLREHAQLLADRDQAHLGRQRAEAASLAKSRFLAAASHDLRQPLHALALFSNALRELGHEPDRRRLVDNIAEAVGTLEDLFTELLDISRIDAGTVEVRPADFAVEGLWRRLRLHFEPVAFDKGLAFIQRGGHLAVHADPVLVERIMRNLVANAVRYTDDGGVLMAARLRGNRVLLQVWDTGIGIAAADRERIFDEFVQVGAARRPGETGRQRGVGLGLAIVRRLADLMDAPIQVDSIPGRGTRFTLALPAARPASLPDQGARPSAALLTTLKRRRIVLIDDDVSCRSELRAWLDHWGAEVEAFGNVSECAMRCEARVDVRPPALVPDLLILGSPPGVDDPTEPAQLTRLRALFGRAVPVLHVGGAPAPPPDGGAVVKDRERLDKPVQPNRLRAMVSFKLGARVDAPADDRQAGW